MSVAPLSAESAEPSAEVDVNLSVTIGSLCLANPVMPASGCFGPELDAIGGVKGIGAAVTKTVFLDERGGNRPDRLTETAAGMFNSVGIPSRGPAGYLRSLHPKYRALGVPVITSIGAHRTSGYAEVLEQLGDAADAYELNVSCPNLDKHGIEIGADPGAIAEAVGAARAVTAAPLVVKLSPMVASIADCALAAQSVGADAVCVSNSVPAMPIDADTLGPALGNIVGGLTGPLIRPVITRLVWLTAQAVDIPVIACGGVESVSDVLEYMSVGAVAVQVGTATFARPLTMSAIAAQLADLPASHGVNTLAQVVDVIRTEKRR